MTSLEIAELTGKQHKHLMEAIRKMEPAWVKVHGSKFRLMFREVAIGNGAVRQMLKNWRKQKLVVAGRGWELS